MALWPRWLLSLSICEDKQASFGPTGRPLPGRAMPGEANHRRTHWSVPTRQCASQYKEVYVEPNPAEARLITVKTEKTPNGK